MLAKLGNPEGLALDNAGDPYIAGNRRIRQPATDSGISTVPVDVGLRLPASVAMDFEGDLVIADSYSPGIRKIAPGKFTVRRRTS